VWALANEISSTGEYLDHPRPFTFESIYAGKAPWDIDKPQKAFIDVADQITGSILDSGGGTGENALFFAQSRPQRHGHRLP